MKNYICINGKKAELTEEQMKALGIELPKANPFEKIHGNRGNDFYSYYYISTDGNVCESMDNGSAYGNGTNTQRHNVANYCTDKTIMEQRALHETLNRLLWRFSMMHEGNKIRMCDNSTFKYGVKRTNSKEWTAFATNAQLFGCPMFYTEEIAQQSIKEIIKPFIAKHPEFKW